MVGHPDNCYFCLCEVCSNTHLSFLGVRSVRVFRRKSWTLPRILLRPAQVVSHFLT